VSQFGVGVEGQRRRGGRQWGARRLCFLKPEKGEKGVGVRLARPSGGKDEGGAGARASEEGGGGPVTGGGSSRSGDTA
jgi:hypothetical protein